MIPFANPETQLQLIQQQTGELIREAAEYRRARLVAEQSPRRRWPWRSRRPRATRQPLTS
jgi:hypothetical protein